jgi:hypothetical protein
MKKMPTLYKGLLPFIIVALLFASCEPKKCDCDKPVFNAPGFPATLDSVYDVAEKSARAYKDGEAVFYTLRMEAADVEKLLADSAFAELSLNLATNSLNNMTMFKLNGFGLDANRRVLGTGRDTAAIPQSLNLEIIKEELPKVFTDSPVGLGTYVFGRQTIKELTHDEKGNPITYTHLQLTPMEGSLVYNIKAYNGSQPAANAALPSGCCGHPSPPAPTSNCNCSGVKGEK